MRVLITTDTVGGVWTFTQELAAGLLDLGDAVALFSLGRSPDAEQSRWASQMAGRWGSSFRFESVETPLEWMEDNARAYHEAAPRLRRVAAEFEAEIFHSNQFCFGALPFEIPVIVTAHSDVLSWSENCRSAPLEDTRWLQSYRHMVAEGMAAADAVVAPTEWMLRVLEQNFTLPEEQHVIPNGRDIPLRAAGTRKLQAVTAGRLWDEAKGTSLLKAVHSPIPILLAGASFMETSGAAAFVGEAQMVGKLSQEDLLGLFCESAIYICTSRYEPFGLAPLEAALCGCVVLANDLPSLREVWAEGALYFRGATELERLLRDLSANPEALAQAQRKSETRAKRFTRKTMSSAYRKVFEQLRFGNRENLCVA